MIADTLELVPSLLSLRDLAERCRQLALTARSEAVRQHLNPDHLEEIVAILRKHRVRLPANTIAS